MPTFTLRTVFAPVVLLGLMAAAPTASPVPSVPHGPLVTVTAHQQDGHDAVVVDGTTPTSQTVTIVVMAKIAKELPDVTLRTIRVGSDGTFHATIGIGQTIPHETVIVVRASASGAATGLTQFPWGAPNPDVNSRMDALPKQ